MDPSMWATPVGLGVFFAGLGVMLAGLGIMAWGSHEYRKRKKGE